MNDPVHALIQSYSRTKARSYKEYVKVMQLHTNSSNNTLFADSDGDIAYFHSNFIPRRDARFRSEEHTSELHHSQISYAVFCLKKKNSLATLGSKNHTTNITKIVTQSIGIIIKRL